MIKLFSVKVKRVKERERAGESQRAFPFFFFLGFLSSFLKAWKPHSFTYTLISSFFSPFLSPPRFVGNEQEKQERERRENAENAKQGVKKASASELRLQKGTTPKVSLPFFSFSPFHLFFPLFSSSSSLEYLCVTHSYLGLPS